MPNWSYNTTTLRGPPELLDEVIEHKFSMQHFDPLPESEREGGPGCSAQWGTKYNTKDFELIRRGHNEITFTYTTAWVHPVPFFQTFLSNHRDCYIKSTFEEEGGMAGLWYGYYKDNGSFVCYDHVWVEKFYTKYHDNDDAISTASSE